MMKTANQILNEIGFYNQTGSHLLIKKDEVEAAMKQYAAEACKEQREICANGWVADKEMYEALLNAPQPTLE